MPKQNTALVPINPFALGGAFLEKSIALGWVTKHRAEGRTTYFLTPSGTVELEKFGIDTAKVRSYRVLTEMDQRAADAKRKAHRTE
jgi:hypothetical protein